MENSKNRIAEIHGYPNWDTMENWIIDHNNSCDTALLLVSAMEDVCFDYFDFNIAEINLNNE